jgi:ABC-type nitrate/sulfonate/bicarbonate transport system substrate-binding protein
MHPLCKATVAGLAVHEGSSPVKPTQTFNLSCFALLLAAVACAGPASAQEPTKFKMARLAFPSMSSMLIDVLKARGIDKKHGVDLETVSQNAVPVYYASIASGEAEAIVGGPHVFQKMMLEGVPIQIVATWAPLDILSVITGNSALKSVADLKGKTIAAAVGSSEYQITAIYARKQGVVFGQDVTVVQAAPPLARTQLQAGRVDAAMLWEPTTTEALRDNPAYRVIMSGDQAWKTIANARGWDLVLAMRKEVLKRDAALVPRLIRMFQETQQYMRANPDDADAILSNSVKLTRGVFKEAVESKRLVFDVQPAWEAQRAAIWDMFKVAVEADYLPKLPPDDAIYKP